MKDAFHGLLKISHVVALVCKGYYQWKAEEITEKKWMEGMATKKSLWAYKTTVRAAVNSPVFVSERLIVTPQKLA